MMSRWQTLFNAQAFSGAATKTSGGLYVLDAEWVQFEFTGATSSLSAVSLLFDPAQSTPFLADTSVQASTPAPNTSVLADSCATSFTDVIGVTLTSTSPRTGYLVATARAGGVTAQGYFPYQYVYLQCVSTATLTLTVRARVKYPEPQESRQYAAVLGSVV